MSTISHLFASATLIFAAAFLLRAILLVYGIWQDTHAALKYTDIDYFVFADAARYISQGRSPYDRATYRYTPLLAWLLLPTTWGGLWFHFGKALFALSDLVAGWLILILLKRKGLAHRRALKYASVWLLNPMVANISTRGSSEGLLCVMVMTLLWAFETRQIFLTGIFLGISVHFKIYPFIYGTSMLWALASATPTNTNFTTKILRFPNRQRVTLLLTSLTIFATLNLLMYTIYGPRFITETFTYHLTRLDHRHNFSPYHALLYLSSAHTATHHSSTTPLSSLAFLPQLLLSTILIPLATAKLDLPTTLLAQTLAFVTFNKVATSQYFLWYLIFLPLYLPTSSLRSRPRLGLTALALWVLGQAAWLQQGYQLEFLGRSTFVPGLWCAGLGFFAVNCWILGVMVGDVVRGVHQEETAAAASATAGGWTAGRGIRRSGLGSTSADGRAAAAPDTSRGDEASREKVPVMPPVNGFPVDNAIGGRRSRSGSGGGNGRRADHRDLKRKE